MNLSRPFVLRPIGTVLLTAGIALAGIAGFFALPVASLPTIELPVIYLALDRLNRKIEKAVPDPGPPGPTVAGATEGMQ